MFKGMKALSVLCVLVGSSVSVAQNPYIDNVTVGKVLVDSANFGGCSVQISPGPETVAANCKRGWVVLDCNGTYTNKSVAQQKLDIILLSRVLNQKTLVVIDPTKGHNGYCLAERVDLK